MSAHVDVTTAWIMRTIISGGRSVSTAHAGAELDAHADASWGDRNIYGLILYRL